MIKQGIQIFILFIGLLGTKPLAAQENELKKFMLKGHFITPSSGFVYLAYSQGGNLYLDSCYINHDNFTFSGSIPEPIKAFFSNVKPGSNISEGFAYEFYIESGTLNFSGEFKNKGKYRLTGSATENDWVKLRQQDSAIKAIVQVNYEIANNIYSKSKSADEQKKILLKDQIDSIGIVITNLENVLEKMDSLFIVNHPQSFVSLDRIFGLRSRFKRADAEAAVAKFTPEMLSSSVAKRFLNYLETEKHIVPGDLAKNFIATDYKGKEIDLSKFRNKYVLLDFWASWCRPCRQLAPELKELQRKYRDKLQIISIAKENDRSVWEKAIKNDVLTAWPQILENDRRKPNRPANKLITDAYYVFTLPTLILIDKQGRIVEKFGDGYLSKPISGLVKELNRLFLPER